MEGRGRKNVGDQGIVVCFDNTDWRKGTRFLYHAYIRVPGISYDAMKSFRRSDCKYYLGRPQWRGRVLLLIAGLAQV